MLGSGPMDEPSALRGAKSTRQGAESTAVGHSQAQREGSPSHSQCPGEILFFSPSCLGWQWGCISAHSPSTNLEEPIVSSLPPLFCKVRGALSPHGMGPWECRGLASGAQMPLAGGGRWLQKRGGNGAPCRGSSFPQEIAQMPYVRVSSLQSLPGMTAGGRGGLLRPECGSDLRGERGPGPGGRQGLLAVLGCRAGAQVLLGLEGPGRDQAQVLWMGLGFLDQDPPCSTLRPGHH